MCLKEIIYKGDEYKVYIRHHRRGGSLYNKIQSIIQPNGGTTIAWIRDNDHPIAIGIAECSIKDAYNKKFGRMIAIGRLLKELNMNTHLALEK